jgi:hypothetical protein
MYMPYMKYPSLGVHKQKGSFVARKNLNRTEGVRLLLTKSEHDSLRVAAASAGVSMAEFSHAAVVAAIVESEADEELDRQMSTPKGKEVVKSKSAKH